MKKQIVKGWAYPCEQHLYISGWVMRGASITTDGVWFKNYRTCNCGNNCDLIRVTVTVEPEVNE